MFPFITNLLTNRYWTLLLVILVFSAAASYGPLLLITSLNTLPLRGTRYTGNTGMKECLMGKRAGYSIKPNLCNTQS